MKFIVSRNQYRWIRKICRIYVKNPENYSIVNLDLCLIHNYVKIDLRHIKGGADLKIVHKANLELIHLCNLDPA